MGGLARESFEARGMRPVTSYARARILLLGMTEAVFGLMVLGMGALAIWATSAGEMRPTKPGDMPEWWMYLVGAALALGGLALSSQRIGKDAERVCAQLVFYGRAGWDRGSDAEARLVRAFPRG